MNKKYSNNFLIAIALTLIVSSPFIANAASEWLSTDSIGRFEYDANKDGAPDVVIDAGDIDKLSQAENTNVADINSLQSKYNSLIVSLDTAQKQVDTIANSGTATAADINQGMTAIVKGNLITGTRTLAAETPGTATASNISKDKTAWVDGKLIKGTGADNDAFANNKNKTCTIYVLGQFPPYQAQCRVTVQYNCKDGTFSIISKEIAANINQYWYWCPQTGISSSIN